MYEILICSLHFLKSNGTLMAALVGMITAASSLAISASSYKRDKGRLDVKIGVWNVLDMTTMTQTGETYIRITVVNSGRRPVIVESLGGSPRFWRIRGWLHSLFPSQFDIVGFFIADPIAEQQLRDNKGEYKILNEGQKLTVSIPLKKNKHLGKSWDEMKVFYVGDSMERHHFAPIPVFDKFKRDIKAFFQKE